MNSTKTDLREIFSQFRARNPKPYFQFEDLPPSERLSYEKIGTGNFMEVFELFKDDDSPFVSAGYRDLGQFERYLEYQLNYHRFTPRGAACDWLVRLKSGGRCIGFINVFDLTKESFGSSPYDCMIGFSTHRDFRRQYYTVEAVSALTEYIFTNFKVSRIIANTEKKNFASKELLRKLGFKYTTNGVAAPKLHDYFELSRTRS